MCVVFRTYSISEYIGMMFKRGVTMISYEPLFQTMKKKKISSYELDKRGFPRSTYYAIKHGKGITTNSLNHLCSILQCSISEVVQYVEDDVESMPLKN